VEGLLGPAGRALHELELTEEQRDGLHAVLDHFRSDDDVEAALRATHEARRALDRAVWDEDAGSTDLTQAGAAVAEAEGRLAAIRHRMAKEILDLLTEEQRAAFAKALDRPRWGVPRP
jgi:Spy/CpxP family protein refolding chaperone